MLLLLKRCGGVLVYGTSFQKCFRELLYTHWMADEIVLVIRRSLDKFPLQGTVACHDCMALKRTDLLSNCCDQLTLTGKHYLSLYIIREMHKDDRTPVALVTNSLTGKIAPQVNDASTRSLLCFCCGVADSD